MQSRRVLALSLVLLACLSCKKKPTELKGPGEITIDEVNLKMTLPAGASAMFLNVPNPDFKTSEPAVNIILAGGYSPLLDLHAQPDAVKVEKDSYQHQIDFRKKHPLEEANVLDTVVDSPDAFVFHAVGVDPSKPLCKAIACKQVGDHTVCLNAQLSESFSGGSPHRVSDQDCAQVVEIARSLRAAK